MDAPRRPGARRPLLPRDRAPSLPQVRGHALAPTTPHRAGCFWKPPALVTQSGVSHPWEAGGCGPWWGAGRSPHGPARPLSKAECCSPSTSPEAASRPWAPAGQQEPRGGRDHPWAPWGLAAVLHPTPRPSPSFGSWGSPISWAGKEDARWRHGHHQVSTVANPKQRGDEETEAGPAQGEEWAPCGLGRNSERASFGDTPSLGCLLKLQSSYPLGIPGGGVESCLHPEEP